MYESMYNYVGTFIIICCVSQYFVSLLTTPVAPMLHPTPAPEGEPSRQRRRVTFTLKVSVNHVSSGSETTSGEDAAAPAE